MAPIGGDRRKPSGVVLLRTGDGWVIVLRRRNEPGLHPDPPLAYGQLTFMASLRLASLSNGSI